MTTQHQKLSAEIEARIKSQIHPDVRIGNNVMDVVLDVIDERLAAMAARIAERDQQLARLRREVDAMINGLYEGGGNDLDEVARAAYDAGGERLRDLSPWTFSDESGTEIVRTSRDGAIVARVYPDNRGFTYRAYIGLGSIGGHRGHLAEHHGTDLRQACKDECDDHLRRWKYVLDVEVAR